MLHNDQMAGLCQLPDCNRERMHKMTRDKNNEISDRPIYLCTYHATKLLDMRDRSAHKQKQHKEAA